MADRLCSTNARMGNLTRTEADIAEAASIVDMLCFVFDHAAEQQDWFLLRETIGAQLNLLGRQLRRLRDDNDIAWTHLHEAAPNGKTH
jgi:hypothetical protein